MNRTGKAKDRNASGKAKGAGKHGTKRATKSLVCDCFVLSVRDGSLYHTAPDQGDWKPSTDAVFNELPHLLLTHAKSGAKRSNQTGKYVVVALRPVGKSSAGAPADPFAWSLGLSNLLAAATERHLRGRIPEAAQTILLFGDTPDAGQLHVQMVMVDDESNAIGLCDKMATGEWGEAGSVGDESQRADRISKIRVLLDGRQAGDYDSVRADLAALYDCVRAEVAERLGPALNRKAVDTPHGTYDEKKELAKWVNAELRRFGLALKCPKTGRPAFLVGHAGGQTGVGRFQLEITESDGRPYRPVTSVTLPALTLMPDATAAANAGKRPQQSRSR
jgi:hypothetical protein